MFVENDQTYYFASNHTSDGQHCYVRLYTGSLCNAIIAHQDTDDVSCRPLLWLTNDVINGADKYDPVIVITSIPVRPQL